MQIIKPLRIGCMSKPIPDYPRSRLALTGMIGFDLLDPEVLHTEQSMWAVATSQLGDGKPIDLWVPKRNGEVLVWGKAVAPGNTPLKKMEVELRLGDIAKTLVVHGRRHWLPGLLGGRPGEAEPFAEMPLTYSQAFGGSAYARCPIGKGHNASRRIDAGEMVELPNVELPGKPILHPDDTPLPASFMPADITWPACMPQATYDRHWLKHRFPAMPADFQWGAYNLAPLDQRVAGFFRGDEELRLAGFHADHPLIVSSLPGVRLRGFFRRVEDMALQEIPMVLDTVCLFPSALSGVLLFRGSCETIEHDGRDIAALMYACERLGEPRPFAHYEEVFALRSGEEAALHALSDFQLMPPFSTETRKRLDTAQDEARQAEAGKRKKFDEWLPAYAGAVAGFAVPATFFSRGGRGGADALPPVPRITAEDMAQGNVDLAAVKKAMTGLADRMLAKADEMRLEADATWAKAEEMRGAMEKMGSSGRTDADSRALLPPEIREKLDAAGLSMRAVADRLQTDPDWPLAEAMSELAKPSRASTLQAVEQLLASDDERLVAHGDKLSRMREAMLGTAESAPQHNLAGAREQQIDVLRGTASALLGEPGDATPAPSATEDFLGSIGLGDYAVDRSLAGEGKLAEIVARAQTFYATSPEKLGQQLAATIPRMVDAQPGGKGIDDALIAAHAAGIASAFAKPPPSAQEMAGQLAGQMATQMAFEGHPGSDEKTVQVLADSKRMMAENVAQHLPSVVKNDTIDWDAFFGEMGAGAPPASAMAGALASLRLDEPADQQALRRARALALGERGANRLGFDIPDEHPDEAAALEAAERFLADPALAAFGKTAMPEMLLAQGEAAASGFDLDKLSAAGSAVMLRNSLTMPPAVPAAVRAASKAMATLPPGVLAGAMMRDKIPAAEAMHRKARQQSPLALLDAKDFGGEIGRCVGNIVLEAVGRGGSLAGRDLAGADLRDANLADVDLTGAFLEHADLRGANLTGARCEGAVFAGARLAGASLGGARLAGANFGGACAVGADFTGADMSDAMLFAGDFTQANLSRVRLGKCNALKANFSAACLDESRCEEGKFIETDFSRASFADADWRQAILLKAKMGGCTGQRASFKKCVLVEVEAAGCDFSQSNFESSVVMKSAFHGLQAEAMQADGSCWQDCDLSGARLAGSRLQRANLIRAVLDNANLDNANLHGALLTEASLRAAGLDGAQLFETVLRGADLAGAQLRHGNLHCADLAYARLEDADLTGARCLQTVLEKPGARAE